ncbi:MAG: hypothetical protein NTY19_17255 [Planctomycetota bacterium]|nr:hypothetical protein [Planctomycetota bacterium]
MPISGYPSLPDPALPNKALPADVAAWQRLRVCAEAETGMDFSGTRMSRLQEAAGKVLARWTPPTTLDRLLGSRNEHGLFLEQLTAELTVGETFFFRNEHHFRALREQVVPAILQRNGGFREIRVWCAGCSSGEEPYSVAILLDQLLRGFRSPDLGAGGSTGRERVAEMGRQPSAAASWPWQVSILATDLNPKFLQRGREAFYRPWSFRLTNSHNDRTYFTPEADGFRLIPRVRDWVRFAYLNLVKDVYPSPLTGTLGLDLILFRNVAIYLKPEVTSAILARFYEALRPGGWLLLGETEVSLAPTARFEVRRFDQATLFYKTEGVLTPVPLGFTSYPVLPAISSIAGPRGPAVPLLPSWSPLPTKSGTTTAPAVRQQVAADASLTERIDRCVATRSLDEAERTIDRIAGSNERARVRLRYAQTLLTIAEIARARRMLELCLREQPLLLEAHLLQASFAEEARDLAAAERAYRRALFIDRNCPMAHFHLGLVLDQKGDRAAARRSFQTTLRLVDKKECLL